MIRDKLLTMNIKERILEMDRQLADIQETEPSQDIEDLLLAFLFKITAFEPCKYVSEDEEWITILLLPPDESLESQIMTLRKSEIISFGIVNEKNLDEINNFNQQVNPESLYQ